MELVTEIPDVCKMVQQPYKAFQGFLDFHKEYKNKARVWKILINPVLHTTSFCVLISPEWIILCRFGTNICLEVQPDHTYDKPRVDVISVYGGPSSPLWKDKKNFMALSGDVDKWTWKYVTVPSLQGYSLDSSHIFLPSMEFIGIINPSDMLLSDLFTKFLNNVCSCNLVTVKKHICNENYYKK